MVKTRHYVYELAKEKESTPKAVIFAFLLKHSGGIRPIICTTNSQQIKACAEAEKIQVSRKEWYKL